MAQKPTDGTTWDNLKCIFAAEYGNLKEQAKVNTLQTNFHGANAAHCITTALDNLGLAATTKSNIVQQLTISNQQLTATRSLLTEQLYKAMATNAKLVQKLEPLPPASNISRGGCTPFDRAKK
jgi:hypothetical protein